jgi:hypothetical protein
MKAMDSSARQGANRSRTVLYGEDLQRRMAGEDALSWQGTWGTLY